jgi:hypothetical protein
MAERQPKFFQILVTKLAQDFEVNVVRGKDLGVLLQSDFREPRAQILGHAP